MKQKKLATWMWWIADLSVLVATPARADVVINAMQMKQQAMNTEVPIAKIQQLSDIPRPHTSAKDLLAQDTRQNQVILVTKVRLKPTARGLEVILETPTSDQLQTTTNREGKTFTAVIPNAQLRLLSGNEFRQDNPASGITAVTVTNQDANSIRVTVTGEAGLPKVRLFDSDQGLVFGFTPAASSTQKPQTPETVKPSSEKPPTQPSAEGNEPIEIVVTGERENGYSVPSASTATKIPVPLRDIPQSIQVIPRQVIEDRQVVREDELTDNVSGVQRVIGFGTASGYVIRGFANYGALRNGFRGIRGLTPGDTANVEQVEFLKGPASVLYGSGISQGGIVNTVTKKPQDTPSYSASFTAGNYSYYRPSLDITGPLTSDHSLLYRLNTSYENAGSYRDFTDNENFLFAPALTWRIDKRTTFSAEVEYQHSNFAYESGFPLVRESLRLPINRFLSEPSLKRTDINSTSITYNLEHKFSENWSIRQGFNTLLANVDINGWLYYLSRNPLRVDRQTLNRTVIRGPENTESYTLQNEIYGKFNTGSVRHNVLVGLELFRSNLKLLYSIATLPSINIFNPVYGSQPGRFTPFLSAENDSDNLGIYVQDLIEILPNLKLLAGVRFDSSDSSARNAPGGKLLNEQSDNKFSPRVGIVYQPFKTTSLYFNWTNYFNPQFSSGRSQTEEVFKPDIAEQFEVGIKQDLFNNHLSANLALYQITRQNVLTRDPDNPIYYVQTGEQKSRGVELDVAGKILPGWNVIATYAYTDAFVSKDNRIPVGNQLVGAPYNSASLWTTYELQSSKLKGLGFGLGLVYAGDVQVSLPNTIKAPSYLRTDASLFYRRNNFRIGVNFKNLFSIKYFYTDGGISAIYPAPPLTVLGTMSVQF